MLIPLPNITYNVQEAIEFYETLKNNYQDLKWSKKEVIEFASYSTAGVADRIKAFFKYVGRIEPYISWTDDQIIEFLNEQTLVYTGNTHFWYIKETSTKPHLKLDRQTELQFGFAKKLLDQFPDANTVEVVVNPVGTKYHRHTDNDDCIRIIIPIIADEGAVWHFDGAENVTHFPGQGYLLLKQYPHATDVFGPNDRVSIHFLLDQKYQDWVTNLKCHI